MIDVVHHINDIQRVVGGRSLDAGEARTVSIAKAFDAPIHDVWDACTNADRIPRWFLPISGELRPGGHFQLEGNAGGTIDSCEPPTGFTATWEYGGTVSWIRLRLVARSEALTWFELEHTALVEDGGRWNEFGPGAVGVGWDLGVLGLTRHLASGEDADRQAVRDWSASDDGKLFMSLSSERWGEADIAAGAARTEADARAARTTQAYTGVAPVSGSRAGGGGGNA